MYQPSGDLLAYPYAMALLGLASSAFFIIVIVANAYPQWVLDACQ